MTEPRPPAALSPSARLAAPRRIALGDPADHRDARRTMLIVVAGFVAPALALAAVRLLHLAPEAGLLLWFAIAITLNAAAQQAVAPPEVTVGADGLCLHARGGTRFIPLDRIIRIRATERRLELRLKGHEVLAIGGRHRLARAQREELVRCVEQAMRARARGQVDASALGLLARRGRSLAAWRAELGRLTRGVGAYRSAALTPDDAAAALESPAAAPEHRIGAALLLAESGEPAAAHRIRIAAAACASAPVRSALEAIAGGAPDEAAVDEALAEADAARAAQRR